MIPRLTPATDPFVANIVINVRLRPYFEKWYSAKKLNNEGAEQFLLRKLKEAAIDDYEGSTLSGALSDIIDGLKKDIDALSTEVN